MVYFRKARWRPRPGPNSAGLARLVAYDLSLKSGGAVASIQHNFNAWRGQRDAVRPISDLRLPLRVSVLPVRIHEIMVCFWSGIFSEGPLASPTWSELGGFGSFGGI